MRIKKRTSKRAELSEENVKRVIKTFEDASSASSHNQTDQYSAQPMLKNNLRDNQEPK